MNFPRFSHIPSPGASVLVAFVAAAAWWGPARAETPLAADPSALAAPTHASPTAVQPSIAVANSPTPSASAPPMAAAPDKPVVCRQAASPLILQNAKARWHISLCRGGVQDVVLLAPQFRVEKRNAPAAIAPWAASKFAAGPLDLVETWDARWDPFRDELLDVKIGESKTAELQLSVRQGQTVSALSVPSLAAYAQRDPLWAVVAQSPSSIELVWPDPSRVRSPIYLWKRFTLAAADHPFNLRVDLAVWNVAPGSASFRLSHEITTFQDPSQQSGGGFLAMFAGPPEHKGAGVSVAEEAAHFDTTALEKPSDDHNKAGLIDWFGVDARYFLLASVPTQGFTPSSQVRLLHLANGVVMANLTTSVQNLPSASAACVPSWFASAWGGTSCADDLHAAGQNIAENAVLPNGATGDAAAVSRLRARSVQRFSQELYAGPKDLDELKAVGHNLQSAVDFGWFGLIGRPMLWILNQAHDLTTSWPLAILMLTLLVKALLWPITAKSMRSMRAMQLIKPELDKMKAEQEAKAKKAGQDKADANEVNRLTFELYKKHKVNPLGGCLPMVLQLPVYIALYRTIQSSVGLYNQPLFGWITDLTQKDPFYVLPLILGAVMFVQQKITPQAGGDPAQQKMMLYFMPGIFTLMMLQLPSGLTLYILTNTLLGIAQTLYTNRSVRV